MNKIIINIFILLWVAVGAMAQTATVTGTVTDDLGPVIGATVTVQGTSIGATTDLDGKFTLTCRKCKCSTEFMANGNLPAAPHVCQNCGQELPAYAYERLCSAMVSLKALPEVAIEEDTFNPDGKGFAIYLDINRSGYSD